MTALARSRQRISYNRGTIKLTTRAPVLTEKDFAFFAANPDW